MKENDLRYIKTEKAIKDAFFSLLQDSDFDKITVKDITERAMINRNTFYLHYKDKFDLINSILISFIRDLSAKALDVVNSADAPTKTVLDKYLVTIFVNANKIKKNYRIIFKNKNIEPYLDINAVAEVIKEHIRGNKFINFSTSISENFLAFGYFGAINDFCTNDYSTEETSRLISKMSGYLSTAISSNL